MDRLKALTCDNNPMHLLLGQLQKKQMAWKEKFVQVKTNIYEVLRNLH